MRSQPGRLVGSFWKSSIACSAFAAALVAAPSGVRAWEVRWRFVERIGAVDVPLATNSIDASDGAPRNIRFQAGVFDDGASPAPEGGLYGWSDGTITVSGATRNSDERRNPGRLAPFDSAGGPNDNGNPPLPNGDPFTSLTEIQALVITQSFTYFCNPDGTRPPLPMPTLYGLNTFVSVYAFQVDPNPGAASYEVALGGGLRGVLGWGFLGTPTPPLCGDPGLPGAVTYIANPSSARPFSATLSVVVPAPGAGVIAIASISLWMRRRRAV